MSLLHKFRFYHALWSIHEFVYVGQHLSKDEEDFKRAIQILEVRKTETILFTVQAQISSLKHRDHARCGLEEEVDWTRGHWRTQFLLDQRIAPHVTSKVHVLSDSVLCLGEKCQEHPEAAKTLENDRI